MTKGELLCKIDCLIEHYSDEPIMVNDLLELRKMTEETDIPEHLVNDFLVFFETQVKSCINIESPPR